MPLLQRANRTFFTFWAAFAVLIAVHAGAYGAPPSGESLHPLLMTELQDVERTHGDKVSAFGDDLPEFEGELDIRRDAQKQAALSFGARGGLAMRSYEIAHRLERYEDMLDKIFDFRSLLIQAPSGFLIEPPIISESENALIIEDDGIEAAVSDKVFFLGKDANIVTTARNWRTYLYQDWSDVTPPPKLLWPKNEEEQANWNMWVAQGWQQGYEQGDDMFRANLDRLVADFTGMVRYRILLSQSMITKPFALHEVRGVTGSERELRVGDRAIRITGPSQFQMDPDKWQPADR